MDLLFLAYKISSKSEMSKSFEAFVKQHSSTLNIICITGFIIGIVGLIFTKILDKRIDLIYEFNGVFSTAFMYVILQEYVHNVEPKYTYEDLSRCMWGFHKMIFHFWIKDERKMFYEPDLYDYVMARMKEFSNEQN